METEAKPMTTKELSSAVRVLLEREESRIEQSDRRRRRRARRRRIERREKIEKMTHSIEVIKWCIVTITSVMAAALLIIVIVIWQIGNEAQRINGEIEQVKGEAEAIVEQIQREAELIRDKIQHPLRSIGGALGGQIEQRIGTALGVTEE